MADRGDVDAVIEGFTAAWAHPDLERFMALLHPQVVLLQPVTKPIHGKDAARAEFARLLQWLPDMRGIVDRHAVDGDVALIVWRLVFGLGGRPYELRIVDRLVVADRLIREREAYYDSLGLMLALLGRPTSWAGYWRYRGYLPR
jgi:ketosteroid isomerase-like protein